MDPQLSIFSVVFAAAAAISAGLAGYVWRRRRSPGGLWFALFMAAAAEWALTSALESSVADMPSKILFARLSYFGVTAVGPLWLLFALDYSRQTRLLRSRWAWLIWAVPAVIVALAFTNDWHGLIWTDIAPVSSEPGAALAYALGPASLAHAAFAYVLLMAGSIILLKAVFSSSKGSYLPVAALVLGILIALAANILYPTSLNPFEGLDITPLAFVVSGLLFTWAIFRQRFFELLPVAREMIIRQMSDGALVLDKGGHVVEINPAAKRMLGLPEGFFSGDAGRAADRWPELARCFEGSADAEEDVRTDGPEGETWLETRVSVLRDARGGYGGRLVVLRDVTKRKRVEEELKRSNETLSASLHEKEMLLKEVHHRVKNNLQIVSSILSLQSGSSSAGGQATVLRDSQERIRSMALVHEMLYRSRDLARIDFAGYVDSLTASLARSYAASPAVRLRVDVRDVFLDADTAIPCGLIINELVANAFKYAFPGGRPGEVCVRMSRAGGAYTLVVSDDGAGIPAGIDFRHTPSLGLQLVNTLVSQLEGAIELDATKGTSFKITFAEIE